MFTTALVNLSGSAEDNAARAAVTQWTAVRGRELLGPAAHFGWCAG